MIEKRVDGGGGKKQKFPIVMEFFSISRLDWEGRRLNIEKFSTSMEFFKIF